jgi:hypothetical protein
LLFQCFLFLIVSSPRQGHSGKCVWPLTMSFVNSIDREQFFDTICNVEYEKKFFNPLVHQIRLNAWFIDRNMMYVGELMNDKCWIIYYRDYYHLVEQHPKREKYREWFRSGFHGKLRIDLGRQSIIWQCFQYLTSVKHLKIKHYKASNSSDEVINPFELPNLEMITFFYCDIDKKMLYVFSQCPILTTISLYAVSIKSLINADYFRQNFPSYRTLILNGSNTMNQFYSSPPDLLLQEYIAYAISVEPHLIIHLSIFANLHSLHLRQSGQFPLSQIFLLFSNYCNNLKSFHLISTCIDAEDQEEDLRRNHQYLVFPLLPNTLNTWSMTNFTSTDLQRLVRYFTAYNRHHHSNPITTLKLREANHILTEGYFKHISIAFPNLIYFELTIPFHHLSEYNQKEEQEIGTWMENHLRSVENIRVSSSVTEENPTPNLLYLRGGFDDQEI